MVRRDDTPDEHPENGSAGGHDGSEPSRSTSENSTFDELFDADGDHGSDGHDEHDDDGYDGDEDDGHDGDRGDGVIGSHVDEGVRRRRGRKRMVFVGIAAAVLLVGIVVAALGLRPIVSSLTASKDYDGPGTGNVTVTVTPGESGQEIADGLQKSGVVLTSGAFTEALAENPGAEIQPGQYSLRSQMKASDALSLLRGEGRDVVRVTVREGLWKNEVYAALSKATGTPVADYVAVEKQAGKDPAVLGLPTSAKGNVEGYLFPATYEFTPGAPAVDQLKALVGNSTTQLRKQGVAEKDMERIVIIASIIEAEARLDADRPKVSRVIANRLEADMPLQLDSTVSYGVQRRAITTSDAERGAKNRYNTYVHPGLPVGPIGNPGAASIAAAQKPADGPWMYFVTVDPNTGDTRFATTDAEHQANVAQFQKWCQANPGKC